MEESSTGWVMMDDGYWNNGKSTYSLHWNWITGNNARIISRWNRGFYLDASWSPCCTLAVRHMARSDKGERPVSWRGTGWNSKWVEWATVDIDVFNKEKEQLTRIYRNVFLVLKFMFLHSGFPYVGQECTIYLVWCMHFGSLETRFLSCLESWIFGAQDPV